MKSSVNEAIPVTNHQTFDNKELSRLKPLLKWAGGKEQELKYIIPNLPASFKNYYEPFVGGGSVYTAIKAEKYFINDKSHELIDFYKSIISEDSAIFFDIIETINENWQKVKELTLQSESLLVSLYQSFSDEKISFEELKEQLNIFITTNEEYFHLLFNNLDYNTNQFIVEIRKNMFRKLSRMKVLESKKGKLPEKDVIDNIETSLKSAFYMYLRHLYNYPEKYKVSKVEYSAIFLFIRNYAYSGMFRYNSKGLFNVPYGGIGYNNKNFKKKVAYLKSQPLRTLLSKSVIENLDFFDFFEKHQPQNDDFIFLDPPYDTEFSTYAQNEFKQEDQKRLADYLINNCRAKWMMVIKNTDFIYSLYQQPGIQIKVFDKKYLVSFMNRNDKDVKHLIITNY